MLYDQPIDEMAEIGMWGSPWHGRVQGGLVYLPNGETRTWPQPDGTKDASNVSVYFDNAGFTLKQQMPGAPAIVRTPAQAAQDALLGMEWRQTAILQGIRQQVSTAPLEMRLYGQAIDGFLYAAPDGSRWRIALGRNLTWSTSLTLTTSQRRFGEFGKPLENYFQTIVLTAAAMGQSTPTITGGGFGAQVMDILPDGSKAIIMLYQQVGSNKFSIGFLLLTMTGTPGVDFVSSVTVLHDRSATLGSMTINNAATSYERTIALESNNLPVDESSKTAYPTCGGYDEHVIELTIINREPLIGDGNRYYLGSGTNSAALTGRIVAMWFDGAGTPQDVVLDMSKSVTFDVPEPDYTLSNPEVIYRVDNYPSGGVCTTSGGDVTIVQLSAESFLHTASQTSEFTWSLTYGAQVMSVTGSHTYTYEKHVEISLSPDFSGGVSGSTTVDTQTGVSDVVFDGVAGSVSGITQPPRVIDLIDPGVAGRVGMFFQEPLIPLIYVTLSGSTISVVPGGMNGGMSLKRWSNNLIGAIRDLQVVPAAGTRYRITQALHPSGMSAEHVTASIEGKEYGSWNPVTGESVIAETTPVSWV